MDTFSSVSAVSAVCHCKFADTNANIFVSLQDSIHSSRDNIEMETFTISNDSAEIPILKEGNPTQNGDVTPSTDDEKTPFLLEDIEEALNNSEILNPTGKAGTFGTSTFKPNEKQQTNGNSHEKHEIILDDYDQTKNPFFSD